jgi:UTP--glucose-1-phosphate uridylyltransferase
VGDEPFAVLLGDTIIESDAPAVRQLIERHYEYGHTIIGVETVPKEKVSRYGVVGGRRIRDDILQVTTLVEKPSIEQSPSALAIAGRYILTPAIFDILESLPKGRNDEVQLTDALRTLLNTQPVYSLTIKGKRYDIGDKLDYLKTQVEYGLKRQDFGQAFLEFLKETIASCEAR